MADEATPAVPSYRLEDFLETQRATPALRVPFGDDGEAIIVEAPVLWTDEIHAHMITGNIRAGLVAMNGTDRWERFEAAGGSWRIVNALYDKAKGATPLGE